MLLVRTLTPTVIFLTGHFQLSAVSVWAGTKMLRFPDNVLNRSLTLSLALAVSAIVFSFSWLLFDPIDHLLTSSPEDLRFLVRAPFVKLLYAPVLALVGPVFLSTRRPPVIRRYGIALVVSGVMVSVMMILNDLFW